eukprot:1160258-Pelagomonas_calceolata.AAC.7
MASPPEHNPNYIHWSEHPRDRIFGAIHNVFWSKFPGFSSYHPIYDDHVMYLTLKHAIYSAILQIDATTTFLLLPSWGVNLNYANLPLCQRRKHALPPLLEPTARIRLNEKNPAWLTKLARYIPQASWQKTSFRNDPDLNARHPDIETGFNKFEKPPLNQQFIPKNIIQPNIPCCRLPHLAQTWSLKFRIGKSGHTQMAAANSTLENNDVYHPANDSPNYIQPNGVGITNTNLRAELAAVAAAILQGHSHIATDSLSSLHQIRKQTLYPEFHFQDMSKAISLK